MVIEKEELESLRRIHKIKDIARIKGVSRATICNWLKRHGLSKTIRRASDYPPLTEEQIQVIEGSLLGDGYLDWRGKYNSRFNKVQCKKHKKYLHWHADYLAPFSKSVIDNWTGKIKRDNGVVWVDKTHRVLQYKFYTCAHPVFSDLREKWYPNGIKEVPLDLSLTAMKIAVWFADDGSNNRKKKEATFHTDCFQRSEVEFLITKLEEFGISSRCCKHYSNYDIKVYGSNYHLLHNSIDDNLNCFGMYRKTDCFE